MKHPESWSRLVRHDAWLRAWRAGYSYADACEYARLEVERHRKLRDAGKLPYEQAFAVDG